MGWHYRQWPQPWNYLCLFVFIKCVYLLLWRKAMTNLDSVLKIKTPFADKVLNSQSDSLSSSHVWTWEFSSVAQLCPTLCDPMDCSMPGLPVHHQLPEFTQSHAHWVGDAIQPSHPLSSPSPPPFNLFQHQILFQWVSSLHQVAKVLEFQLQHQSFQWIFRTDFLYDGLIWSHGHENWTTKDAEHWKLMLSNCDTAEESFKSPLDCK